MSKTFDPDKHYVKVRGMGRIHYEQNGHKFDAGFRYIGNTNGVDKPAQPKPKANKDEARERARAKIAAKLGKKDEDPLEGFRPKETPDAVSTAVKEDAVAKAAEEHA